MAIVICTTCSKTVALQFPVLDRCGEAHELTGSLRLSFCFNNGEMKCEK